MTGFKKEYLAKLHSSKIGTEITLKKTVARFGENARYEPYACVR